MRTKVEEDYVRSCDVYQRNWLSSSAPYGLLQTLPIPGIQWSDVATDMFVKLPNIARGSDSIMAFVDRLPKMVLLIPIKEKLFHDHVVCKHGMP
jgi:hypothetical protein